MGCFLSGQFSGIDGNRTLLSLQGEPLYVKFALSVVLSGKYDKSSKAELSSMVVFIPTAE